MNDTTKPSRVGSRIAYILAAYGVALVFFTLFRVANTVVYLSSHDVDLQGLYYRALLKGVQFDSLVSCFVLAVPLLLVLVGEIAHINRRWYYMIAHCWVCTFFIICFFACAADIPYYNYSFTHLDAFAVQWGDEAGAVLSMIVSEPSYIAFFFVFVVVAVGYWLLMRWLYRRLLRPEPKRFIPLGYALLLTAVLGTACFFGMRGRFTFKTPLRVGTAYFCDNAFLNTIGLNPVFTLMKSLEAEGKNSDNELQLADPAEAHVFAERWLTGPESLSATPDSIALPEGTNVVVVLMESMSAYKMGYYFPEQDLTPNLDSLMRCSMAFTNTYSAGIHTHNGIMASLYSFPALRRAHLFKQSPILRMCGLPQALQQAGYSTTFVITHDSEFDNLNGFVYANGIEHFISQKDYDADQVVNTWGVPDHVMFDKVLQTIDTMDRRRPFFVGCLTCSDHGPFFLPTDIDFTPTHGEIRKDIVQYADWAIGRFMRQAAERPWFDSTVFVFVADHGATLDNTYDLTLAYNHVPMLFHCPAHIAPQATQRMALQIDLGPTLLGMLGTEWDNHTLGIDLTRRTRPYAYFSADYKIGAIDSEWFYVYRIDDKSESLYHYADSDPTDHIALHPEIAEPMRRYAFSMLQEAQQRIKSGATACR